MSKKEAAKQIEAGAAWLCALFTDAFCTRMNMTPARTQKHIKIPAAPNNLFVLFIQTAFGMFMLARVG